MKTITYLIPMFLLLSACGTMQNTTSYADDVYDIPDRQVLAAQAAAEQQTQERSTADDYYDPSGSREATGADRDYYDMTYNDPYYYNYGRFGFGTGIGSYGPSYGMGMSYGWPTTFGSMSIGYGTGYGAGYGYNPYTSNSWMSGYGYDPYGYYGYGNYGYGYGGYGSGYGSGYGPYQSPWGGCYGCYEPTGYGTVVYSHRPSMTSGSYNTSAPSAPRMMRNPAGLLDATPSRNATFYNTRNSNSRPGGRIVAPRTNSNTKKIEREPASRPSRTWDSGTSSPSSPGGGSNSGGGRISSPRPR